MTHWRTRRIVRSTMLRLRKFRIILFLKIFVDTDLAIQGELSTHSSHPSAHFIH